MTRSLFLAPLALAAFTSTALAHFQLIEPKQDRVDTQGKTKPCGNGTAITDVTTLTPGQTLDVKVNVTQGHKGYFRVALAKEGALPGVPDGVCTALKPATGTLTAPILFEKAVDDQNAPPTTGQKILTVKVPDTNCQDCRLQVVQVMAEGDTGCFYYHCAKVNVGAALPPPPDAGPTAPGPDAGPSDDNANNSGGGSTGGCSTTGGQLGWALLALGALIPFVRRRRA